MKRKTCESLPLPQVLLKKQITKWNSDDVSLYLKGQGVSEDVMRNFSGGKITGQVLLDMSEDDLLDLGISQPQIGKNIKAIPALQVAYEKGEEYKDEVKPVLAETESDFQVTDAAFNVVKVVLIAVFAVLCYFNHTFGSSDIMGVLNWSGDLSSVLWHFTLVHTIYRALKYFAKKDYGSVFIFCVVPLLVILAYDFVNVPLFKGKSAEDEFAIKFMQAITKARNIPKLYGDVLGQICPSARTSFKISETKSFGLHAPPGSCTYFVVYKDDERIQAAMAAAAAAVAAAAAKQMADAAAAVSDKFKQWTSWS